VAFVSFSKEQGEIRVNAQQASDAMRALKSLNKAAILLAPNLNLVEGAEIAAFDRGDEVELSKNLEGLFLDANQKELANLIRRVRVNAVAQANALAQKRSALAAHLDAAVSTVSQLRAEVTRGEVLLKLNGVRLNQKPAKAKEKSSEKAV
jgi:hypothetical protein